MDSPSNAPAPEVAKEAEGVHALSQFQKFVMERIPRKMLRNAPYNPRTINDYAREKLKANLKKRGLVMPLVWNRLTGNLVSGHQRLSQLDALEGNPNYALDVAVVEMDDKTEREQNLFLNNFYAQGDWDAEKLVEMAPTIDVEAAGFDAAEMAAITGHIESMEADASGGALAEKLRDAQKAYTDLAKKYDADTNRPTEFYLVVVFKGYKERLEFTTKAGLPDYEFVDGRRFSRALGLADPIAPVAPPPRSADDKIPLANNSSTAPTASSDADLKDAPTRLQLRQMLESRAPSTAAHIPSEAVESTPVLAPTPLPPATP